MKTKTRSAYFFNKKNERGAAILIALFTVTFVIFLAGEISKQSFIEYFSSANAVKKVQAHHAAQACLRLSLLRIKGYQQASFALGSVIPDPGLLDKIWNFPLSWPPMIPKEASEFDNSTLTKTIGTSLFKHQFLSSISSEGGKIDINDLGSPSEGLRNKTKTQLLQRLQARVLNEEDLFARRYSDFSFEELVNNIADWIDSDQESLNGGGESAYYSDLGNLFIPPNRPFKTMEELHMVSDMTDDIYEILKKEITLYGIKGINLNQAGKDVLLSLFSEYDPQLASEIVKGIMDQRKNPSLGGPFKNEKEFMNFLSNYIDVGTFNNEEKKIPLFFGKETNFLISCTGISGKMTREIQAVVYDPNTITKRLQSILIEDWKTKSGDSKRCKDLKGQKLYECQCQNIANEKEKNQCITSKKNEAENKNKNKKQKKEPPLPGPPPIIFQEIK